MIYKLNSTLTFGKYKDSTIVEIIKEDPNYLDWCLEEIEHFELTDEAKEKLNEALEELEEVEDYDWRSEDEWDSGLSPHFDY